MRALLALAAFVLTCLTATLSAAAVPAQTFNEIPASAVKSTVVQEGYRIGSHDVLDVLVFQVEDLSKTVRVDGNGNILLPLIGEVSAAGRTTQQLSDDVAAELGKKYMNDPRVTVTLKESATQRVTVDGQVIQPGVYPISGETTLMQAIALAQGTGELADLRRVAVLRTSGAQRMAAVFDLTAIREGRAGDPRVLADDVIIVETSGRRKFLRSIRNALPLFQLLTVF